ncbi:MAG: hypothetical protein KA795_13935 [Burkholderiaceae bacterium]|nr:hypothetical protein [Burkholderiaceae bacterium]
MIFAIEATDFDAQGSLERIRWHCVDLKDQIVHGTSEVLTVEQAVAKARGHSVHVCFQGAPGTPVMVGPVNGRMTFIDHPDTAPAQRLTALPPIKRR